MRRRALLANAAGSLPLLAGCVDSAGERAGSPTADQDAATPTDDPSTPPPTHANDHEVTVESVHQQWGYVSPNSPDSIGVTNADTRYVVARISVDGPLRRDRIGVGMGDQVVRPLEFEDDGSFDRLYRTSWGDDEYYASGNTSGLVYFEVEIVPDGVAVDLLWPGGEYSIEGALRERLGRRAQPMAAELDVPEEYAGDSPPSAGVDVTNQGDVTGRFLGAVNRVGPHVAYAPIERISGLVDPGGTRHFSITDDWMDPPSEEDRGDGEVDVTYHLHWAGGRTSADI